MDTKAAEKALVAERERLLSGMRGIGRENPAVPGEWEPLPEEGGFEPDPLDRAELMTSREDTAAVLADLEARYASVMEALARVTAGTYGRCEVCSKPIERRRLGADPAATTCALHR